MLTVAQLRKAQPRRRSPYSDRQHYHDYILQRIEGYKNSIGRDELLRLGDEAAAELQAAAEGQLVLTEVLMLDSVDRLIMKRLAIRPFNRWRRQFLKLREAQRTPTHWGMDPGCSLARLLPRIEQGDSTLVIGTGAEPAAYLLAAHDATVAFVAGDLGCIERVESRMAVEALGWTFEGYVAQVGPCVTEFLNLDSDFHLVVLDPGAILDLSAACRCELVTELKRRTRPGGVHVVLPTCPSLAPAALLGFYDGWVVEEESRRRRRGGGGRTPDGLVISRPPCTDDTAG